MENESVPWKGLLGWITGRARQGRDVVRQLEELIEAGTAEGVINAEQEEMLLAVLSFRRTLVREVMVPRTEMVCIEVTAPLDELVRRMVEEAHSRVPVFEGEVEHVVGFVTARDVLRHLASPPPHPSIAEVLRPPYFVPETMNLGVLLAEFRRRRIHMAMAVDEYGGISGLVTLEDVLEEIVGEIQDEYDDEGVEIHSEGEHFLVDARTEIEKVEESLGVDLGAEGDYETAGGMVFHALGRIPRAGESFRYKGLEITVLDVDKRRVKRLKLRRVAPREQHGEHGDSESKP